MPAPSTYIDITTIPLSRTVTTAEFNGGTYGGVANEVWFRYVAPAGAVLGVRPNVERVLTLTTSIFASDGTTTLNSVGSNRPLGLEVAASTTYYVRIRKSPSGAIGSNFTAEFDTRALLDSLPSGAFFVNDFGFGGPAIIFDTDGTVLGYKSGFPDGEFAAMLADGTILIETSTTGAKIFDANLDYVSDVSGVGASITIARGKRKWWAVESGGEVATVSATAVVTPIATLPTQPASYGVSLDETILYYVDADSPTVKRWSLTSDSALADLYTEPGFDNAGDGDTMGLTVNFTPNGELLVLSDGSVVTWWLDFVTPGTNFLHLSSSGTLLNRITVSGFLVDHPQLAIEGSGYIFVWMQDFGQTTGKFGLLDLSTGLFASSFTTAQFGSMRNGNTTDSLYWDAMFGPETSCVMLRLGPDTITVSDPSVICCATSSNGLGGGGSACGCDEAPSAATGTTSTEPLPSRTGPITGAVDPTSPMGLANPWTPLCTGGGTVPTASDATDAESWVS